jgi:hypothetical protein
MPGVYILFKRNGLLAMHALSPAIGDQCHGFRRRNGRSLVVDAVLAILFAVFV